MPAMLRSTTTAALPFGAGSTLTVIPVLVRIFGVSSNDIETLTSLDGIVDVVVGRCEQPAVKLPSINTLTPSAPRAYLNGTLPGRPAWAPT